MTDQQIIEALIARDENLTCDFFYRKCRPLFASIIRHVFSYDVDYDEFVNEFYLYLMENDAHRLKQFANKSTIFQWMKVVAIRYFLAKRDSLIDMEANETTFESAGDDAINDSTCVAIDTCAVGYYDEFAEIYRIDIVGYNGTGDLRTNMGYTLNLRGEQIPCEFSLKDAPSGTRIEGNKLITGLVGGTIVICGKGDGFNIKPRTLEVEMVKTKKESK
ncbi:MAG: hypothetical protein IKU16_07420 [Muribaculaceae bacterium]|nr:hypothetical protein [Muribaculaceae bacterium]